MLLSYRPVQSPNRWIETLSRTRSPKRKLSSYRVGSQGIDIPCQFIEYNVNEHEIPVSANIPCQFIEYNVNEHEIPEAFRRGGHDPPPVDEDGLAKDEEE
jgi:hypothetical protein